MRFASLVLLAASACTAETSTGQLSKVDDTLIDACDSTPNNIWGCQMSVVFDGETVTATGATASARGTLNAATQTELSDLIATIPLDTAASVHDGECGLVPVRSTTLTINWTKVGARDYSYQQAEYGSPMYDLHDRVIGLLAEIRTCNATHIAFSACGATF